MIMAYLIQLFFRCAYLLLFADCTLLAFKRLKKTWKRYRRTKDPAARTAVRHELFILLGVTIAIFGIFCLLVVWMSENSLKD